jgi:hypothetical protein
LGRIFFGVEAGNLWEELWVRGKPKKERASQLIYYAIADAFCKANNLDISPEANMGGGPIDFKFSYGYDTRVLVEMKRSGGTVVHGYEKQLEFYKKASQTDFAIFVIVNYGDLENKLSEIHSIRQRRLDDGERASEIVVVDATPKASASRRTLTDRMPASRTVAHAWQSPSSLPAGPDVVDGARSRHRCAIG